MRFSSCIPAMLFRKCLLIPMILTAAGGATVCAQEASRTVDQTYVFDERGDAKIEFSFQLSAAQWAQWKDQYGDHPDILLRDVKYQLAAAVIDDFALEKDDVHRHALAKIKARSLARYRGNGEYDIQVPKNMKLVAGSGVDWAFTNSALEQGGIVNMTYHAKLPSQARNVHLTTGNDYDLLVYSLDAAPTRPMSLFYAGVVLLFFAVGLGAVSFLVPAKQATPPPIPA